MIIEKHVKILISMVMDKWISLFNIYIKINGWCKSISGRASHHEDFFSRFCDALDNMRSNEGF